MDTRLIQIGFRLMLLAGQHLKLLQTLQITPRVLIKHKLFASETAISQCSHLDYL